MVVLLKVVGVVSEPVTKEGSESIRFIAPSSCGSDQRSPQFRFLNSGSSSSSRRQNGKLDQFTCRCQQSAHEAGTDRLPVLPCCRYLLFLIVTMGFQQFYLHGRASNGGPVTRHIVPLVVLHGILMSSWVVAFIVHSSLIVAGKRKLHISSGIVGVLLATGVVVVGVTTAIASVHYNPDEYKHIWGSRRFLSPMLTNVLGFGTL